MDKSKQPQRLEDYFSLIREWGKGKGLDKGSSDKQVIKVAEEQGELAAAYIKGEEKEFVDSMGDIVVALTILADQQGLKLEDIIKDSYEEIKNRVGGKLRNGVFVSQFDLDREKKED